MLVVIGIVVVVVARAVVLTTRYFSLSDFFCSSFFCYRSFFADPLKRRDVKRLHFDVLVPSRSNLHF